MMDILSLVLDLVLIGLLGAGISFAMKLTKQLSAMRASRAEMERLVLGFNSTVNRAEAGVKSLKETARSSGDDLEKLIEKGSELRDELIFLIESADTVANRLTQTATAATQKKTATPAPARPKAKAAPKAQSPMPMADISQMPQKKKATPSPTSAAEQELLRVLKKMG